MRRLGSALCQTIPVWPADQAPRKKIGKPDGGLPIERFGALLHLRPARRPACKTKARASDLRAA